MHSFIFIVNSSPSSQTIISTFYYITQEDYSFAAQTRDQIASCKEALSSQKQLMLGLLDKMENGATERDRIIAAQGLGDLGDWAALPLLQSYLTDEMVGEVAEASMWSIFMRAPSAEIEKLVAEGMTEMSRPSSFPRAVETFGRVITAAPTFAEGYNKRATTLYLMRRHREAIEDCRFVLELNSFHFGAATGMGMCFTALGAYSDALLSFETAFKINPRLVHLKKNISQLKAIIAEQQREGGGNGGNGGSGRS